MDHFFCCTLGLPKLYWQWFFHSFSFSLVLPLSCFLFLPITLDFGERRAKENNNTNTAFSKCLSSIAWQGCLTAVASSVAVGSLRPASQYTLPGSRASVTARLLQWPLVQSRYCRTARAMISMLSCTNRSSWTSRLQYYCFAVAATTTTTTQLPWRRLRRLRRYHHCCCSFLTAVTTAVFLIRRY